MVIMSDLDHIYTSKSDSSENSLISLKMVSFPNSIEEKEKLKEEDGDFKFFIQSL